MPRIKNIGDIELYRPNEIEYKYVNALFNHKIDWSLIENNFYPMMRVIASIREGKEKSSFFLKKLTTYRKSNKLFLGFREIEDTI
jgi:TnpA family transposase